MSKSKRLQQAHDSMCEALGIMTRADTKDTFSAWRVLGHLDILLPAVHELLCEELGHGPEAAFEEALQELTGAEQPLPFED